MNRSHRVLLAVALAALALVAALGIWLRRATLVLDAPEPAVMAESADSLPRLPSSLIEASVTYDLETAIDSLEAAVPRTYGNLETRQELGKNERVTFSYRLRRSPFRVHVKGQTVRISADIEYAGRVWYDPPIGPELEAACGTGEDPPRRARLTLETTGELTRDWGLRTRSRVVRLEALTDSVRDRCRVTFLRIDVTDRLLAAVRDLLDGTLAQFDGAVARWPVRHRFEKIWGDLQKPIRLADSVYMTIDPTAAQLGAVGAHGGIAFAQLRLFATPRVVTGARPILPRVPLPPLERGEDVGRGVRVLLDASFTYPVASTMLKKALVGRTLVHRGYRIRIRDARLSGIGGGRVALRIDLVGSVRGAVYFTGTPGFDLDAHQITVPDLDYDAGTVNVLLHGYELLQQVRLRDFLRDRARIPDSAVVNRLSQLAETGINRPLPARGTRLRGRIHRAGVIAVHASLQDIRVRAVADADLSLSIDRAPSIPRPPAAQSAAPAEGGSLQAAEGQRSSRAPR
jgi:Domain of unknown function (DUF4403)